AIFPAKANSVLMVDALGYADGHPHRAIARRSIEKLLALRDHEAYCQPCVSPVWDTALACHSLLEVGSDQAVTQVRKGLEWLAAKQILELKGDWIARRPDVRPGGWAFQYANPHYPDVDDTAVVVMAMDRALRLLPADKIALHEEAIARGREWIEGMQSRNGGWGAFDADNDYEYLNHIPFADHGALLDPPTADVSARCLSMLSQLGCQSKNDAHVARAIAHLKGTQEQDGSWCGGPSGCRTRHCLSPQSPVGGWPVAGGALYRNRISARLLFALSWLRQILPALGSWPLSELDRQQCDIGDLGHLKPLLVV